MTGYIQATMSHPTGVEVGKEYSWYIAGEVVNGSVHNPALVGQYFESESESSSAEETAPSLTMEGRRLTVKQTALGKIFIGHDFRLYCVCVQEKPWWEQEVYGIPLWVPAAVGAFGAGLGIGMVVRK
jgi:hypothetical protein